MGKKYSSTSEIEEPCQGSGDLHHKMKISFQWEKKKFIGKINPRKINPVTYEELHSS